MYWKLEICRRRHDSVSLHALSTCRATKKQVNNGGTLSDHLNDTQEQECFSCTRQPNQLIYSITGAYLPWVENPLSCDNWQHRQVSLPQVSGECLACCDIFESKENLGRIRPKEFDSLRTKQEPPKMKLSKTRIKHQTNAGKTGVNHCGRKRQQEEMKIIWRH